jgi:hypothetical protein
MAVDRIVPWWGVPGRHLMTEGIFRVPGSAEEVNSFKAQYNLGALPSLLGSPQARCSLYSKTRVTRGGNNSTHA